uniref:Protein DEPP1 isoform X1 n=2 Tax=Tursiops truncatus TaxID=9739 RepID=A0A6J3Q555_TURTR|nr:protein DEPP1 isoform X1 [Tursiops truncatus]XP_033697485.1 protein DEPP1 isoform X1 [Tursiops truncatus]
MIYALWREAHGTPIQTIRKPQSQTEKVGWPGTNPATSLSNLTPDTGLQLLDPDPSALSFLGAFCGLPCSSGSPATPRPPQLQVAASLWPAAMRSRLLLSVAHLPTIRETLEEMLPGGPGEDPPASPSLDDYVKSICQLAQPTSVPDEAAARVRPSRPHRPARSREKSCTTGSLQDITTRFSGQQPTLPGASTVDPLDWLFGESQENRPSGRDMPRRTGSSADPWASCRQTDSGKARGAPRGRLSDVRVPGHSLLRPQRDWRQCSQASGQPGQDAVSPTSPRPSSILRTLYLHLPVIHEL